MRFFGRGKLTCNDRLRAGQPHSPWGLSSINRGEQPAEPHPEVGWETAQMHLWLVESSLYFHGAWNVAAISDAVCLPVWNVRRALFALGLGPDPCKPCVRKVTPTRTGRPIG